jgi:enamine deaminase RidA (YjgF/YER057c/UK114 family)
MPRQNLATGTPWEPVVGYSRAVRLGPLVHVSGTTANGPDGKLVGAGDIAAQVEQVFRNVRTVVEGCGGTMDDIVKITVYVTDAAHRPAVAAARQRHFPDGRYPASTYLVVSGLAIPELLVEIEAVAMVE